MSSGLWGSSSQPDGAIPPVQEGGTSLLAGCHLGPPGSLWNQPSTNLLKRKLHREVTCVWQLETWERGKTINLWKEMQGFQSRDRPCRCSFDIFFRF